MLENAAASHKPTARIILYPGGVGRLGFGVIRRTVRAELGQDPERQGAAVLVKLDRIVGLGGNVFQEREVGGIDAGLVRGLIPGYLVFWRELSLYC